ncbi:hypothetical protein [uncultured Flavobacterium sp.]|uniref:hypothetical protein n=1 Tax=uncultured Flavobacterium sp. TaxID=165435 RepID=UPI0025D8C654|nr:hypothetical protein [uncultured Flavobacterium sp.]
MTNLETTIIAFEDWSKPYEFFKSVSEKLSSEELALFQEIWNKASDPEIWKGLDIVLGCKTAHNFIRTNYALDEHAIGLMVRAISYQWR